MWIVEFYNLAAPISGKVSLYYQAKSKISFSLGVLCVCVCSFDSYIKKVISPKKLNRTINIT